MMGPFKCPDCGTWWAGFEHRCREPFYDTVTVAPPPNVTVAPPLNQTISVRCTCPPERGDNYYGGCPVHDMIVSYTFGAQSVVLSLTSSLTNAIAEGSGPSRRGVRPIFS